jgi:mRNA interferase MazF
MNCAANFDNIQTVPKSKIGAIIASLPVTKIVEVNQAISFALGFDEFPD